jgi:threonine/homoserine/homoserine lactone efflux protein
MDAHVLPLAITMMAGPQIISSIIFVTRESGAVKVSLAYVSAIFIAACLGILICIGLAEVLGNAVDLTEDGEGSTTAKVIQIVLVGLLILRALTIYLKRADSEPPKWLGALQTATPRRAFEIGALLILLFPGDIVVMLTTGVHLVSEGHSWFDALPLILLTTLIAASPLLFFLLFRHRAEAVMPRVRDWMNSHSWVINILVCLVFIALIL